MAAIRTHFFPFRVLYGFQPVSKTPVGSYQASRRNLLGISIHLHAKQVIGVQIAAATATVSIASMVFSFLKTSSLILPENNSPISEMPSHDFLPIWK